MGEPKKACLPNFFLFSVLRGGGGGVWSMVITSVIKKVMILNYDVHCTFVTLSFGNWKQL